MGLQNGLTLKGGIELTDSYLNINYYIVKKKKNILVVYLDAFKDKSSRDADMDTVLDAPKKYVISGTDFTTYFADSVLKELDKSIESQIYSYLKALPEYSGFSDIIE